MSAPKRICVLSAKGGVGKTTIALHLARVFSDYGKTVLTDLDPQGSARAWGSIADKPPFQVGVSEGPQKGYDFQIIDTAPKMPIRIPDADIYIVPTTLDGMSFIVYLRMIDFLTTNGKSFIPVAMRVNKRRREHVERLKDPDLKGAIVISDRACFTSFYGQGTTVFDMETPWIKKARDEMRTLATKLGVQNA